jgi:hypothetical protein
MKHSIATAAGIAALLVPAGSALARTAQDPAPRAPAVHIAPAPDQVDRGSAPVRSAADGGRYEGSEFVPYAVMAKGSLTGDYGDTAATPVSSPVSAAPAAADTGFDWGDAAIGSGAMALLLLLASAAAVAVVRHRSIAS